MTQVSPSTPNRQKTSKTDKICHLIIYFFVTSQKNITKSTDTKK